MKTYTIEDIRNMGPCYDPSSFIAEDWEGTLIDILDIEKCPAGDRIWVVSRLLDDRTNRLFAVWCAREALKLVEEPDPRSVHACNVAEKFALGEASAKEMRSAAAAADDAPYAYADADDAAYASAYAYAADVACAYAYANAADVACAYAATRKAQVVRLKELIIR